MRLIDDWWAVLKHAWTIRLAILIALLNGVSAVVYFITASLPVPPIWLIILNGALTTAIPLLRLIPQKKLRRNNSGDPDADR
ncbi:hypothetical protein [Mesorhizobium sp. M1B.F.Ca.ET.045.04.1.1]|uniref:DUF7940 domain-containing protein n=1 Tax=Mesorhizobium sp. M1B.F.Ca.ET.045.04.1.1 TaxID=2493673 RepID=UPI000F7620D5|nr:hypothetical protein [Mesorhizobium sp. M1B.F.Ca.ET.045.04.1.1]AZO29441.1 hypothetical protein EJ071_19950 [Mesorhizobium sp. M1B.F.Ca.ET.045.04.1.1]